MGDRGRRKAASQGHTPCPPYQTAPPSEPPAPRSLEVTGRGSPSDLAIGWAPAPGPREGYRVAWHQEGSQRPLGGLVDVGPESSGLTLRDLLPGSCYTVSVWTWAGSLCSSTQMTRACTRESWAAAPGPAQDSGRGVPASSLGSEGRVCIRVGLPWICLQACSASYHPISHPATRPPIQQIFNERFPLSASHCLGLGLGAEAKTHEQDGLGRKTTADRGDM